MPTITEIMEKDRLETESINSNVKESPSFLETSLAAIRTSVTGGNTFLNMVENKRMMPSNDGDSNFYQTQEFNDIVNSVNPNASLSDLEELREAKNPEFLQLKARNQMRYHDSIATLEAAGWGGTAMEMATSLVDLPSWLVGGAVFKGAKLGMKAMDLQRHSSGLLANMATSSVAASSAIYTTEKIVQAESGVNLEDRADTMALYGGMFGMALPFVAKTFTSVATGDGRVSLANNTMELVTKLPGTGSMRGFFSMSSADQLIHKGASREAQAWGELSTTRVTASKDANGNFVTASDDTAMDYVQTTVEREVTNLHLGALENSKRSGLDMLQQSHEDGKAWNDFTNGVEQTVRRDVGKMTDDEVISYYKEFTGIEVLPFERQESINKNKAVKIQKDIEVVQQRVQTQINNLIQEDTKNLFNKKEATRKTQLKKQEESLSKKEKELLEASKVRASVEARKQLKLAPTKSDLKKQERIDRLNNSIRSIKEKIEPLRQETVITPEEIALFTKQRNTKMVPILNKTTRGLKKQLEELQAPVKKELPEDIYDVVASGYRSKKFDEDYFKIPDELTYIQDFYKVFGKDATDVNLKGIAGKDSRGYGHIKYNPDTIMADVTLARSRFKEMLMDDELNKALIAKGKVTEEAMDSIAESMVQNALDRDFTNKYLDGGRGAQATSATKQRRLRMNRSLYPEYFVNDINVIGTEYADKIAGKIAMKKIFGLDTDNLGRMSTVINNEVEKVVQAGRANGASERALKRDAENVRAVMETILGSRKYTKDPDAAVNKTTRMLRKGASALYNAGFVKYAIVEPTVAIMRYGLAPVIDNFVPAFKAAQQQIKNSHPNDPLVKITRQAGLAIQIQRGVKYDRYDNMEVTPTTGKTEMFLDKVAHYARKYSGFNYVNDVSDFIAGGAALSELQKVMVRSTNLTKQEASRMARYGLSSDDLTAINKQNIIKDSSGQVTDWNYDNWKDQDLAKKLIRYLGRSTRDTIMRADGTRVHRWQSDVNNPLASMALQFTQMPVALYERLLLNLGDEVSARTAVGIITGVGVMYSILKLEDMAMVASRAKDEYEEDDKLLIKAVTRTPIAGIVPNFIDTGLMLTGNSPLGSAFAPRQDIGGMFLGAGYGVGNKILKTGMGLSDGLDGIDVNNLLKITPIINSMPVLNIGMKALEKDLKDSAQLSTPTSTQYKTPLHMYLTGEED